MVVFIGNVDYAAFDELIDLQAGATGFTYNVTIISNPGAESTEIFNIIMSFISGGTLRVTQDMATIQILDDDGKKFLIISTLLVFK